MLKNASHFKYQKINLRSNQPATTRKLQGSQHPSNTATYFHRTQSVEKLVEDLNRWTAEDLVRLHNSLATENCRIKSQWKKSKRVLIERIRSFGEYSNYNHRFSVTENGAIKNAKSISDLVKSLVKTDLNYSEIVRMVRDRFPSSATTTRSVASFASKQRTQNDKVPFRKRVT